MIEQFLFELRQRFLLRWILANVVGWTIGLYMGILNPICFAGAGVIAGLVLGASQWWALRDTSFGSRSASGGAYIPIIPTHLSQPAREWITATFAGAAIGLFPALLLGAVLLLFSGSLAAGIAGAVLGLAVGFGQWRILKHTSARMAFWLVVNTVGGAACGWLTLMPVIRGLPIGLLVGSAVFGYVTGRALQRLMDEAPVEGRQSDDEPAAFGS